MSSNDIIMVGGVLVAAAIVVKMMPKGAAAPGGGSGIVVATPDNTKLFTAMSEQNRGFASAQAAQAAQTAQTNRSFFDSIFSSQAAKSERAAVATAEQNRAMMAQIYKLAERPEQPIIVEAKYDNTQLNELINIIKQQTSRTPAGSRKAGVLQTAAQQVAGNLAKKGYSPSQTAWLFSDTPSAITQGGDVAIAGPGGSISFTAPGAPLRDVATVQKQARNYQSGSSTPSKGSSFRGSSGGRWL